MISDYRMSLHLHDVTWQFQAEQRDSWQHTSQLPDQFAWRQEDHTTLSVCTHSSGFHTTHKHLKNKFLNTIVLKIMNNDKWPRYAT